MIDGQMINKEWCEDWGCEFEEDSVDKVDSGEGCMCQTQSRESGSSWKSASVKHPHMLWSHWLHALEDIPKHNHTEMYASQRDEQQGVLGGLNF